MNSLINKNSNIDELIGEEFDEMAIKFLSFAILDCNINLCNSIIEYYEDHIKEASTPILKQILNNEAKLAEFKSDIATMKDSSFYNEVYQIKESTRVMDNHHSFSEVFKIIVFLIETLVSNTIDTDSALIKYKDSIDKLLQHLYNLTLQSSEATFEEIGQLNQYYKDHQIEIKSLEFFKIFYYLHHKSNSLSNYFLSRTKNQFNKINYYNNDNKENTQLNQYLSEQHFTYETIKCKKFKSLFLRIFKLIESYNIEGEEQQPQQQQNEDKMNEDYSESESDNEKDEDEKNKNKKIINLDNRFKFNFYFDVHFLLNIKDYETLIKLVQSMDSEKLKNLNYLGFLNNIDLNDPECYQLLIDFVKFGFFKNRLIVEHALKNSRLDLVKLVLENNKNYNRSKKIKRLSQEILVSVFNKSEKQTDYELVEYLTLDQKDLIFDSLLNKFSLFNRAFLNNNIQLCKIIMKNAPTYVEIKIKDIKESIKNHHFQILEFFYIIGSKVLKNRILTLTKKYYRNHSKLTWLKYDL
ncbi:hypothetical protein DICPUDRAFT_78801 [Dictyostelium purpureum]|uniref:Uncharacterized protein n=1 Tax=Dictyostelium purpureum TaxID=5786 RepID=F0ZKL5_DICPU|nr:uncharacterized protein DICPUDRAFT_78801 [Dictyostelium purpureum]EGC35522.1 hypothetical protein DICPUDRAFT_78801 [Dictyostelium purpureum]|eukprot:XP_003287948.1 hypothetical protein DICPUDRAFT_78801 [Dictyostelium purpureum]